MDPKYLNLLRIHDACQGLSAEEIESLAENTEVIHAATGDLIHAADQAVDALYIVVHGVLRLVLKKPDGRRKTLRYISTGDQFGALMLIGDADYPADLVVEEPAILLRMKREDVFQLVDQFPAFRRNLLRKVGCGVRELVLPREGRAMPKVVAFICPDDRTRRYVAEFASRLAKIGEQVGILCDSQSPPPYDPAMPFESIHQQQGETLDREKIHATIRQWTDFSRIVAVLDQTRPTDDMAFLLEAADAAYCFAATDEFDPTIDLLKRMRESSPAWNKKTRLIWILGEEERVSPLVPDLPRLVQRDFKVRSLDTKVGTVMYSQGIDRVVHDLRGVSIGLALSGGAAHGMAHLGVLKAFEEEGIVIDRIAGTSAGVLTGVIYCAGFTTDWAIHRFPHDLEPKSIYKSLPKGDGFYMLKQYRTHSWEPMLRKYLNDWQLQQCPLPVSTVTTDLITASSIVRTTGDAVNAILESINLPVMSPPICRDGMLLVDGGILNNLPADVLIRQGCNVVIGVDVAAHIEHRMGDNFPYTPTEKMKAPGVVNTLLRCFNVQAHNLSQMGAQTADITITPDVSMFEASAFTRTPEMAGIGRETTLDNLPKIREILQHLDGELFGAKAASVVAL